MIFVNLYFRIETQLTPNDMPNEIIFVQTSFAFNAVSSPLTTTIDNNQNLRNYVCPNFYYLDDFATVGPFR